MKLLNKKTGEIIETDYMFGVSIPTTETFGCKSYDQIAAYSSLAELNDEWEDYEEPKTFWTISWAGEPEETPQELKDMAQEIGNYFETEEEAEKAVEKLKAWKRMKDSGFRITGHFLGTEGLNIHYECDMKNDISDDLDLLFCSEVENEQ